MGLLYFTLQTQQYLTYIEKTGQQFLLSMNEPDYSEWKYYLINDRYKLISIWGICYAITRHRTPIT